MFTQNEDVMVHSGADPGFYVGVGLEGKIDVNIWILFCVELKEY